MYGCVSFFFFFFLRLKEQKTSLCVLFLPVSMLGCNNNSSEIKKCLITWLYMIFPYCCVFFSFLNDFESYIKKTNTTNHSFFNILREAYCILFLCDYIIFKKEHGVLFMCDLKNLQILKIVISRSIQF